ncbi:MAG: response regulator transcription factor [Ilumatobacteraceae bacterium]
MLVVEDDRAQRQVLAAALQARGYRVHVAATGSEAIQIASATATDLVVLDLGLPDVDGLTLVRHLRVLGECPIVVVTADADDERIVQALDLGAEDYVTKPFSMPVLLARMRVALRHAATYAAIDDGLLRAGDVEIDLQAYQLRIGGRDVDVNARQLALLAVLVRNQGRVLSYAALARLWGAVGEVGDGHNPNTWRVAVSKLRKTLGSGPDRPAIETIVNIGYRLVVPEPAVRRVAGAS